MRTPRNSTNVHSNPQHPYSRGANRNGNGDRRNFGQREYAQRNRNSGRGNSQGNSGYNPQRTFTSRIDAYNSGGNSNFNQGNNEYYPHRHNNSAMIAITAATVSTFGLTAKMTPQILIQSGISTLVVRATTTPYTGWITVGGKSQIPILAIGDISFKVIDPKGRHQTLKIRNFLYAPELKFNLLSVPAAVEAKKEDFRFSFNRMQCAISTSQHFSVKAKIATHAALYIHGKSEVRIYQ